MGEFLTPMPCWSLADARDVDQIRKCIQTAIGAKQLGLESVLSKLVAEACVKVMPPRPSNFEVDCVRVTKIHGGNVKQSFVVEGMALTNRVAGTETSKEKAKVAVYAQGIELSGTETKGTVLLESAEQLMNYTKGEESRMDEFIKGIRDAGVEVVI